MQFLKKNDNKKYLIQKQDKFIVFKTDSWCVSIFSTIGGKKASLFQWVDKFKGVLDGTCLITPIRIVSGSKNNLIHFCYHHGDD